MKTAMYIAIRLVKSGNRLIVKGVEKQAFSDTVGGMIEGFYLLVVNILIYLFPTSGVSLLGIFFFFTEMLVQVHKDIFVHYCAVLHGL